MLLRRREKTPVSSAQIKEIITPLGWTVERLIVRFLEWLVDPETQEEAIAWLMKAKEELGEK